MRMSAAASCDSAARMSGRRARMSDGMPEGIVGTPVPHDIATLRDTSGVNTSRGERPSSTASADSNSARSEEHTSELQSPDHLVCRPLLQKKNALPHER